MCYKWKFLVEWQYVRLCEKWSCTWHWMPSATLKATWMCSVHRLVWSHQRKVDTLTWHHVFNVAICSIKLDMWLMWPGQSVSLTGPQMTYCNCDSYPHSDGNWNSIIRKWLCMANLSSPSSYTCITHLFMLFTSVFYRPTTMQMKRHLRYWFTACNMHCFKSSYNVTMSK